MSTMTANIATYSAPETNAAPRAGLLSRVYAAIIESRERAADRAIRQHQAYYGLATMDEAAQDRADLMDATKLPFVV